MGEAVYRDEIGSGIISFRFRFRVFFFFFFFLNCKIVLKVFSPILGRDLILFAGHSFSLRDYVSWMKLASSMHRIDSLLLF
jgi:hypothetical protein